MNKCHDSKVVQDSVSDCEWVKDAATYDDCQYSCVYCEGVLNSIKKITTHLTKYHMCETYFEEYSNLTNHITVESDKCPNCGTSMSLPLNKKKHLLVAIYLIYGFEPCHVKPLEKMPLNGQLSSDFFLYFFFIFFFFLDFFVWNCFTIFFQTIVFSLHFLGKFSF